MPANKITPIVFCALLPLASISNAAPIDLSPKVWNHITFDSIPETNYKLASDNSLEIDVNESSSFLLMSFKKITPVSKVSFQWKKVGDLKVKDSKDEQEKSGDDMPLRIGLLLHGKAPLVPFFAPGWIKMIKEKLHHPSESLIYLVVGSKTPAGSTWPSPYDSSIKYESLPSKTAENGWNQTTVEFPQRKVVGLWLMADGDNSKSSFKTFLRNLELN